MERQLNTNYRTEPDYLKVLDYLLSLPLSASVTALVIVIRNLVTICSKKLLVVFATVFHQRPPTTHNKLTAALN
jgi:hypothetical protein